MSIVISAVATALVLSPVFVLAGWFKTPERATARSTFNSATSRGRRG